MKSAPKLVAWAIPDIPLIKAGDDIADIIADRAESAGLQLQAGDALVIASKIVAKAEGRNVALAKVCPSSQAGALAAETGKDPRLVELILSESQRVSRKRKGVLVTQHRLGFVSANAGIDQSNIEGGDEAALLLPLDPDGSADRIRAATAPATGCRLGRGDKRYARPRFPRWQCRRRHRRFRPARRARFAWQPRFVRPRARGDASGLCRSGGFSGPFALRRGR